MSRVAKTPVLIPKGVEVAVDGLKVVVKGNGHSLEQTLNSKVAISQVDNILEFSSADGKSEGWAQAGTARSLVNNMIIGVDKGFEKRLLLNGVGYRAQAKGSVLNLTLGFSHPVEHPIPKNIKVETPSQTEIIVKGVDKQLVSQIAADIRAYRPPEPYKGKGVRYADEHVRRKEAKKK